MKNILYYICIASVILFSSCDLDEQNFNPDTPTKVVPEFLSSQLILDLTAVSGAKRFLDDSWIMKSTSFTELMEPYLYNKFGRGGFGSYLTLIDAQKMISTAAENGVPEGEMKAYLGLKHFAHAYYFYRMTMNMGDIPCTDILKGETESIFTAKYDPQEKVFEVILNELKESVKNFNEATDLKGDMVFNGDTDKWKRVVNSFTLRVLSMVSKKTNVGDINIQKTFEEYAKSELIANEDESFQRVFNKDVSSEWYPFYYESQFYYPFPILTSTIVDMLKGYNDYRLFYYGEPAEALNNHDQSSPEAYSGVDAELNYGTIQQNDKLGLCSHINERYYRVPQGEPVKIIAYSEIQFVLAEAALKGWKTPLSAKEYYDNGVRAALNFVKMHTPSEFSHGVEIDDNYIEEYLNGPAKFNEAKGLELIMHQKYLASFFQLPYNSYYDYRRTGLPVLPIDPETNLNEVPTQLPLRWMYPIDEYSHNTANVEAAVQSQFDGKDDTNSVMWILK